MSSNFGLEILFILILVLLNGIFSAGEFAIISSRKSKIKQLAQEGKERHAATLLEMKENPERFLSIVQIGVTLFGTLASAIGGILSIQYVRPLIARIPGFTNFGETGSLILVVAVLTYLFLIFGELVPKYIGINYKERVALRIAPLFRFVAGALFFLVNFMTKSTMIIVGLLNLKKSEEHVGESEIKILIEEGRRKGVFDRTEEELIHGVFGFAERSVKEVMVPKPNVYAIEVGQSRDEIMKYVIETEFSRYPVYSDHPENVIGIVYQKDITKQIWSQNTFDLKQLVRKPLYVPDTMEISHLLKEMQKRRQHMAVVVDEYGTTVGIVTLEDIMEEIFGEIMDETDVEDRLETLKNGSVIVDASYSIRDLNHRLATDLPESPDYETLGGFILTQLQGLARGGEIVYHELHRFTVVGIQGRRITKVKVEKIPEPVKEG